MSAHSPGCALQFREPGLVLLLLGVYNRCGVTSYTIGGPLDRRDYVFGKAVQRQKSMGW